ncbi:MAG: hypothetical protein IPN24_06355 [Betaproteobacteria bacterium]|nr:hypothetical protein [Betaproteobacteria bacterium]
MADGRVMLAGGLGSTIAVSSSAVVYDPVADAWSIGPSLAAARLDFPLVRLLSGRLLAISGYVPSGGAYEPTAESYDPLTNAWGAAGSLSTPRRFHTATVLHDGRVLVTGGAGGVSLAMSSAEVYTPATNGWSSAAPMLAAREQHSATLLASGKVLVVGGGTYTGGAALAGAEVYDPQTNTWSPTAPLPVATGSGSAATLADGRVLALEAMPRDATNAWTAGPPLLLPRSRATATALTGCAVLAGGGFVPFPTGSVGNVEAFETRADAWTAVGVLPEGRSGGSMIRLQGGDVLIAGGLEFKSAGFRWLSQVYRYVPPSSFACQPDAPTAVPAGGPFAWLLLTGLTGVAATFRLRRR